MMRLRRADAMLLILPVLQRKNMSWQRGFTTSTILWFSLRKFLNTGTYISSVISLTTFLMRFRSRSNILEANQCGSLSASAVFGVIIAFG